MHRPPRPATALALSLVLVGAGASAQTAPETSPAPLPPPPPSDAADPQGPWRAPPPLGPGEEWRRSALPEAGVAGAEPGGLALAPRCEDTQQVGRIVAESLAATATMAGTFFATMFLVNSSETEGGVGLSLLAGMATYIVVTPLAVHLVGRNFGGNGKYWASMLGGLLMPVVGHVTGYELSHETVCDAPRGRAAGPPGRPPLARRASAPRFAPAVVPGGAAGGAVVGVTLSF